MYLFYVYATNFQTTNSIGPENELLFTFSVYFEKDSHLWPSLLKPNNNLREKLRKQYLWAVGVAAGSRRQIVNNGADQLQLNGINGNFRGKKINIALIRTGSKEPQYCE